MNKDKTLETIEKHWDSWYIPGLSAFIDVENLTTMVDPEYLTNGKLEESMDLVDKYINQMEIQNISKKIYKAENGLPIVVYVVEPTEGETKNVLIYGHLDKQPYGDGWWADTPPNRATLKGDLLYGRGGADDGYAPFSAILGIKAAQE